MHHTFRGHSTEIVCLSFNPQGTVVATGSMDNTARLWDVETGECLHTLLGHTAEVRASSTRIHNEFLVLALWQKNEELHKSNKHGQGDVDLDLPCC